MHLASCGKTTEPPDSRSLGVVGVRGRRERRSKVGGQGRPREGGGGGGGVVTWALGGEAPSCPWADRVRGSGYPKSEFFPSPGAERDQNTLEQVKALVDRTRLRGLQLAWGQRTPQKSGDRVLEVSFGRPTYGFYASLSLNFFWDRPTNWDKRPISFRGPA